MKDLVIKKPIMPDEKKKKKLASKKQTKRKVDAVKKRAKKKQKGPVVDLSVYCIDELAGIRQGLRHTSHVFEY
ncbi:hypothetical protein BBO99_00008985 [Phytophthora kernoviae]|uniref:Uncharacterized protein n=2 Tax=Phytophthora kernoviae TaxID=325452 RepID=A0A3R7KPQ4_9STRA|nr:hypothetical protein G195_010849 [Phytophthora kernoviae 00238/432]KAG2506902.1 hypothetical protein JM16_009027 [Phytophthora kernoviae]KAG2508688.1 hypothetical protein JM18_009137 [Phytophthora kernoviae]RLN45801.1 hypothetical protein BBI17_009159 [Phytophthora kernoviae]RLN74347.1 hypothetical protein BBO99_00008985 [Phytophthora kernoviae]